MTVLDSSAVLAWLLEEPGHKRVDAVLEKSLISTVNWSEVLQKVHPYQPDLAAFTARFSAIGLHIIPFSIDQAEQAATLYPQTKAAGLSLGDRACLALALTSQSMVLTADRAWRRIDVGVSIGLIQ
ncbi:MAG: type II toxin-antitoxin system VapC family toxin [Candidatus Competibacteraceae bacterium]|nr:type II toxin-antitoxin system VapC family toxin [Candidatus Competibacteraceae bacterium]MCB1806917.1 type II toxin-antitoxin system VapC family toxin [Candidatus Competibacteraceae bacterium]MCB1814602.1 type II toxin-antitoxin system VapC family toxin [Candidatus Competibacteraceae bacterium]